MLKGEIWSINLDPTIGAEIKKTRPAVIVSEDAIGVLPLRVIVPLTDWKDRYAIALVDGTGRTGCAEWTEQGLGCRCIPDPFCCPGKVCTANGPESAKIL